MLLLIWNVLLAIGAFCLALMVSCVLTGEITWRTFLMFAWLTIAVLFGIFTR